MRAPRLRTLPELRRHFLQIASPIPRSIRNTIPWCAPAPQRSKGMPAEPPRADIFWTFTHSAWNTTFKLLFLASSAYTVYLMTTEYKATQDPSLDTFKIEYLLGGSAVLAILFPYEYKMSEVRSLPWRAARAALFSIY